MLNIYSQSRHQGFTLVELMIGVAILAILMSVAVPSFQTMILDTRVRNAAESVQSGLLQAQGEAIKGVPVSFTLNSDTSWTLNYVPPASSPIATRAASEGSKNVTSTFLATDLSASSEVTLNSFGKPLAKNKDNSLQLARINFSIPGGSQNLSVTIGKLNVAGTAYSGSNIKMCDPSISLPSTNPRACN